MKKQVVVFDVREDKKHSVCYKTSQKDAAVSSVYVKNEALGSPVPKAIKGTFEVAD